MKHVRITFLSLNAANAFAAQLTGFGQQNMLAKNGLRICKSGKVELVSTKHGEPFGRGQVVKGVIAEKAGTLATDFVAEVTAVRMQKVGGYVAQRSQEYTSGGAKATTFAIGEINPKTGQAQFHGLDESGKIIRSQPLQLAPFMPEEKGKAVPDSANVVTDRSGGRHELAAMSGE